MPGLKRKGSSLDNDQEGPITKKMATDDGYSPASDRTLTVSQSANGRFYTEGDTSFRKDSNPTLRGYSTGYHEAIVTTDTFNFFSNATDNGNGTYTLNKTSDKSFSAGYDKQVVNAKTLDMVSGLADGYRTDTAQTILSGPNAKVAGHPGSEVDTKGSPAAHDLLREKIMDVVVLDPGTKGMSEASLAVLFGSVVVTSIAPGESARGVEGGTASLKGGDFAKTNWETNRNESKARVKATYDKLTPDEKEFVYSHSDTFMKSIQNPERNMSSPSLRPTSPLRQTGSSRINEVAGGRYDRGLSLGPTKTPPASSKDYGMYFTEPFRAERQPAITSRSASPDRNGLAGRFTSK